MIIYSCVAYIHVFARVAHMHIQGVSQLLKESGSF